MRLELTDLSEQTYRTIGAVGKDPLSAIDFFAQIYRSENFILLSGSFIRNQI